MEKTTKEDKRERWAKCQYYIKRTGNLPEAKALAKTHGFGAATSVWITAFSKLLATGWSPSG